MTAIIDAALANLLSPMVLCFVLGLIAGLLRSDLEVPEAIAKGLALYLMFAIGFKGGVGLAQSAAGAAVLPDLVVAIALSFLMPLIAFALLRGLTRLDGVTAAAVSAHYGSISIVTFVAATAFLAGRGLTYEGHITAMVALMETPAIITGLLLAQLMLAQDGGAKVGAASPVRAGRAPRPIFSGKLLREVFANGSVVVLTGAFLIGWITGREGMGAVGPFIDAPFKGVLCLFLLDMGLLVVRRFAGFSVLGPALIGFGLLMPLVGAVLGLGCGVLLGLSTGGVALLATLCASASYIAVPAAMRLALPKANPSIYVSLSLAVTFPFNIAIGIPLYTVAAEALTL